MFASLFLPRFRLQAACRWRKNTALSVVVDPQKNVVLEISEKACESGIIAGMTSAQAMARALAVKILAPSPTQEKCLARFLTDAALTLSADVEENGHGTVVADLRARPKPACWQQFGDDLVKRFLSEQLDLQVGVAPTPDLAILAAREARKVGVIYDTAAYASNLPIAALEPSDELRQILSDWGISRISDFQALPKTEVIERLGTEAKALLTRVSGRNKRPLRVVTSPPEYREAFDFEHEIDTTEPLLFLLRRFLESLTTRLRAVYQVADKMILGIPLDTGETYERTFSIPAPTTDIEVLCRILHTHLETLRLKEHPVGVRLELHAISPHGHQLGLFETAIRDPNRFGETLARLKAFLGNDRVGIPRKEDTHRPDAFYLGEAFEAPCADDPVIRGIPLRRYRPARTASVRAMRGAPVFLEAGGICGVVNQWAGPFRLSGNWWDEGRWQVEEWDVELDCGIYRLARHGKVWRLEGCYDGIC